MPIYDAQQEKELDKLTIRLRKFAGLIDMMFRDKFHENRVRYQFDFYSYTIQQFRQLTRTKGATMEDLESFVEYIESVYSELYRKL